MQNVHVILYEHVSVVKIIVHCIVNFYRFKNYAKCTCNLYEHV